MLSRSETGVVVAIRGHRYTIRLTKGNKVITETRRVPFKLGDKCHVCFDNSTGKVTNVLLYDEPSDILEPPPEHEEPPSPEEIDSLLEAEYGSVLGNPEGEG